MDNNNIDNVFENLTPVTKNNRYAKQDCDLKFNPDKGKNGKFEVSDSLFRRLNLNDNGFYLLTGNGRAFVGIVENDNAVQYAGRPDADNKTKEFASTEMRDALNDEGLEEDRFWLEEAGEKDGIDYYELVTTDPEEDEEVAVAQEEETQEVSI